MTERKAHDLIPQTVKPAVVERIGPAGFGDGHHHKAVRPVEDQKSSVCRVGDCERLAVLCRVLPLGIVIGIARVHGHIAQHALHRPTELIRDHKLGSPFGGAVAGVHTGD